jgi:arsenate reductase (glutaredoxin)
MHPIVYGIPNCDTVKKARTWLADHGLEATFHDFKKQGVPEDRSRHLAGHRGLGNPAQPQRHHLAQTQPAQQASVTDSASAKAVMLEHASTIKRPVIAWPSGQVTVGFTPDQWPL